MKLLQQRPDVAATDTSASNDTNKNKTNKFFTIHRLDRLTSGLVLLAKTSRVAQEWGTAIQQRTNCTKVYLARVQGRFLAQCPINILPRLDNDESSVKPSSASPTRTTIDDEQQSKEKEDVSAKSNQLPWYGEWSHRPAPQASDPFDTAYAKTRARHAFGYWITGNQHHPQQQREQYDEQGDDTPSPYNANGKVRHDVTVGDFINTAPPPPRRSPATKDGAAPEDGGLSGSTNPTLAANNPSPPPTPLLWFHLVCPTRIEQPKDGVCTSQRFDDLPVDPYLSTVKAAHAAFAVLHYDVATDSTVVLCQPFTGRTHQIRTQLQFLGHPIANDPNYGGDMWYHNPVGQDLSLKAQEILNHQNTDDDTNDNEKMSNGFAPITTEAGRCDDGDVVEQGLSTTDTPATSHEVEQAIMAQPDRSNQESLHEFLQRTCVWCARNKAGRDDRAILEFLIRSDGIWLHALQYTVQVTGREPVTFRTKPPSWSMIGY